MARKSNIASDGLRTILFAGLGPPIFGIIFIPLFRMMQETFGPTGVLEGRDLTAYANRDELTFKCFAGLLFIYSLVVAWRAPGWTFRTVGFVVAAVAGAITVVGVFFALMAS